MQNEVTSASITCHASFSLLFWPAESWLSAEGDGDRYEVTSASITCHASFSLLFWPAESWVSAEVDKDRNDFFLAITERCL